MTPHEREELLKLWRDVPDTQPEFLRACDGDWLWEVDLGIDKAFDGCGGRQGWEAAAIARDAMVKYISARGWFVQIDNLGSWEVWEKGDSGNDMMCWDQSAIAALVAACRTIAGKP